MTEKADIKNQVQAAIANERKTSASNDSKRALITVFLVIPGIVLFVGLAWLGAGFVFGG